MTWAQLEPSAQAPWTSVTLAAVFGLLLLIRIAIGQVDASFRLRLGRLRLDVRGTTQPINRNVLSETSMCGHCLDAWYD